MESMTVEVFSNIINNPIVKIPGRKFPGVVIQGDSLRILYGLAEDIYELCKNAESEELKDLTIELKESLANRLAQYEAVLKAHKLDPPYSGWVIDAEGDKDSKG